MLSFRKTTGRESAKGRKETGAEGRDQLAPALYFSPERCADMNNTLRRISNVKIDRVAAGPTELKNGTTTLTVDFTKDGKKYHALFAVAPDQGQRNPYHNPLRTYSLTCQISTATGKGQKHFTKTRACLDYLQIEQAIVFVFHEAFVEDEEQREAA